MIIILGIIFAFLVGYVVYYNIPEKAELKETGECSSKFRRKNVIINNIRFTTRFDDVKRGDTVILQNRYDGKCKITKVVAYSHPFPPMFEGSETLLEYLIVAKIKSRD